MKNTHLRLGRLEYHRSSTKMDTKFAVPLDRYLGEDRQAHLISVYGGDSEIGAISAAIYERHTFTVLFSSTPWGRVSYKSSKIAIACDHFEIRKSCSFRKWKNDDPFHIASPGNS